MDSALTFIFWTGGGIEGVKILIGLFNIVAELDILLVD